MIELSEDCIFISDAHYNETNEELFDYLEKEKSSMIIFMGDIFDLLFGSVEISIKENKKLIDLINKIALNKTIIYLEGNHDFNLKTIFSNISIIPIKEQPLLVSYKSKTIALAHGDHKISFLYNTIYSNLIRNKSVLKFINTLNKLLNNKIFTAIKKSKEDKDRCYKIKNFKSIITKRLQYYEEKYIIEGHYHQDKQYIINDKTYINLPAFICKKEFVKIIDIIK